MKPAGKPTFSIGRQGLRVWRLVVVGLAAALLHNAAVWRESTSRFAAVPLNLARHLFPSAVSVGRPDVRGLQQVRDVDGEVLGFVLTTSPQTDDLVGYSGPNNLLVGMGFDGRIVGMELVTSGDTEAHVRSVLGDSRVWTNYEQWLPRAEPPPEPRVVSGSTLTSLAIAEAMRRRLAGLTVSLRFPQAVTLAEVRELLPSAASLQPDTQVADWRRVLNGEGELIGYAVRTAPYADNVRGYRGPTECLVAVAEDRQTLLGIRLRQSYDSADYVDRVREDREYLTQCAGFSLDQWATMDFTETGLEGVSGATQTSYGIAEGLRRRLKADRETLQRRSMLGFGPLRARDLGLALLAVGAGVMSYLPGRGRWWTRRVWQVMLVGGYGLLLGDLLSVALLVGWAEHGVGREVAPGLVLLATVALVMPWATRRQVYCQHLCPHGVVQDWLRHLPVRRWVLPGRLTARLRWLPGMLLGAALLLGLAGRAGDLSSWEPFDAWTMGAAAMISLVIAGVGLAMSCWVPMAYCRFGCPTGSLLKFVRSRGGTDRWSNRDTAAAFLLFLAVVTVFANRRAGSTAPMGSEATMGITRVGGSAFGTSWSVTTRRRIIDPADLQARAQEELKRIERSLSHWYPESSTALFNTAKTTRPVVLPPELIQLLLQTLEVSRDSKGALDVTVAPLVRAWGFGPGVADNNPAGRLTVESARDSVGWQKLRVNSEKCTVAKLRPELELDFGAVLQGYAADRLTEWMRTQGFDQCLVDVGGELRAVGAWEVAVEDPRRPGQPLFRMTLTDGALATSGVYRGSISDKRGQRRAHILDPRSGSPVSHDTLLVAVQAPLAVQADAWATALLVVGGEEAEALAAEHGLRAWVVQR